MSETKVLVSSACQGEVQEVTKMFWWWLKENHFVAYEVVQWLALIMAVLALALAISAL